MREMRERDWFWLDNALVDRYDLNIYEKMLYVCLARHIGSNDYAYPKLETLAKELGIKDTRTIVKHTKSLEQKGLITVERLKGKANRYYLNNVKVDTSNVPTLDDTTLNVPTSHVGLRIYIKKIQLRIKREKKRQSLILFLTQEDIIKK